MSPRSTASIAILILAGTSVQAGGQDWLYGRPTYQAAAPAIVYAPNGQPIATAPAQSVQVSRPVLVTPQTATTSVQALRPTTGFATSPTSTVQTFNNPSVYSGYPAGSGPVQSGVRTQFGMQLPNNGTVAPVGGFPTQSLPITSSPVVTNRVPLASTLRGSVNPIFPNNTSTFLNNGFGSAFQNSAYPSTSFRPSVQTIAPTSYTSYSAPLQLDTTPRRRWRFGSGLARFFNSLLGRRQTNYYSSYYRAPITYYRPVTAVDPNTGTTITVQQPCSSYVQQLQRVPVNSFAPIQQGTLFPTQTCQPSIVQNGVPGYGLNSITPGSFAPPSSIGQVGAIGLDPQSNVIPIPSTAPLGSPAPNTQPLTGESTGFDPEDNKPLPVPSLESRRVPPETDAEFGEGTRDTGPGSLFKDEEDDSMESDMELTSPANTRAQRPDPLSLDGILDGFTARQPSTAPSTDLQAPDLLQKEYSSLRPIGAPESIRRDRDPSNDATPTLPPATSGQLFRGGESSASQRTHSTPIHSAPVREATSRSNIRQVSTWQKPEVTPQSVDTEPRDTEPSRKRQSTGWTPNRVKGQRD